MERKRSIDVNKLSIEEVDLLSEQLGNKIREICDKTVEDINRLVSIYGMKAKFSVTLAPSSEKDSEEK
jgi:hypothetical protein